MGLKQTLGLDGVELVIHFTATAFLAGMAAEIAGPSMEDPLVLGIFAASTFIFAWRRNRVLARQREVPASEDEIADLHARVAELEQVQGRVLELEERLDFTERLLVQQREPEPGRLAPGKEG